MNCQSCEALTINGLYCHEHGCPDAWMGTSGECEHCGSKYKLEDREQQFCDQECVNEYYG